MKKVYELIQIRKRFLGSGPNGLKFSKKFFVKIGEYHTTSDICDCNDIFILANERLVGNEEKFEPLQPIQGDSGTFYPNEHHYGFICGNFFIISPDDPMVHVCLPVDWADVATRKEAEDMLKKNPAVFAEVDSTDD